MENIKESLDMYVNHRTPTGGFLYAVLCNDLIGAYSRADLDNRRNMEDIVRYVYNELPVACFGSKERVDAWLRG